MTEKNDTDYLYLHERENYKKLLDILVRSTDAWNKTNDKLTEISRILQWNTQEMKDLNNEIRSKPCLLQSVPWSYLESYLKAEHAKRNMEYKEIKAINNSIVESNKEVIVQVKKTIEETETFTRLFKYAVAVIVFINTIVAGILAILK